MSCGELRKRQFKRGRWRGNDCTCGEEGGKEGEAGEARHKGSIAKRRRVFDPPPSRSSRRHAERAAVEKLRAAGVGVQPEQLAHVRPVMSKHVNRLGRYEFDSAVPAVL